MISETSTAGNPCLSTAGFFNEENVRVINIYSMSSSQGGGGVAADEGHIFGATGWVRAPSFYP